MRRGGAVVGVICVAAGAATVSTVTAPRPHRPQASAPSTLAVTLDGCVRDRVSATSGRHAFLLRNDTDRAMEVQLLGSGSRVVAEVEAFGPQTTRTMDVVLAAGSYSFRCLPDDVTAITSTKFAVTAADAAKSGTQASPEDTHGVRAVTAQDLLPATLSYRRWVSGKIPSLIEDVGRLRDRLARGDRAGAKKAWLNAHHTYETLGAAYGAFGDLDDSINGSSVRPGGHTKSLTGFHRVEAGLWAGESARDLVTSADKLAADVRRLRTSVAHMEISPLDIGLRAHEIVEDTIQFELTGRTDYGSHSYLDVARANLAGTRKLLGVLHPLLKSRYDKLGDTLAWLHRTDDEVKAVRRRSGAVALDNLPREDRERVNADVSELAELLAPVAAICDIRRTR